MIDWVAAHLFLATGALVLAAAAVAVTHALLYKEEVRAAIAWVGLILLVPLLGSVLYYLIGINRIRRRAVALRRETERTALPHAPAGMSPAAIAARLENNEEAAELAHLVGRLTKRPLLPGNRVRALSNGDEAYPAMLRAIRGAEKSIALLTYIFDSDSAGNDFIEALGEAHSRGVEVRVLIDAVGARYSRPRSHYLLRRKGVPADLFLSTFSTRLPSFNLRNHRKILVVDGRLGFTGGMNIREGFVIGKNPRHPGRDLHFEVEGPVVRHLQEVFAEDWEFTTGEALWGSAWFPPVETAGESIARGIPDGPDDDIDTLNFTLLGAIASATKSIRVVTPYFLPDPPLVYALNTAALCGLEVDLVVPEAGNLPLVTWAMWGQISQVLAHGCRVFLTPKTPFDHSKLMVIDDYWVLFGSTNWDPRSLRLNFEFDVECYDKELARAMHAEVDERIARARRLTLEELGKRSLPRRFRDGAARLLTPYL
jgi:cardiolipin synthase